MEGQVINNDSTDITVKRSGRQLPALPSKIPVRRDQSLPSSGRSTPCLVTPTRPGLKREGSSPPGLLFTGAKPRPPLAPKPSLNIQRGQQMSTSVTIGPGSRIPRPKPDTTLKKWDSTSKLEVSSAHLHVNYLSYTESKSAIKVSTLK